ncbi:hypothetical protein C8R45DRAFT_947396 [Mycena sanguinolenta]|nr:hypothetical protein C8R45DRAFT_947396 [Mycena sanguinolenta]
MYVPERAMSMMPAFMYFPRPSPRIPLRTLLTLCFTLPATYANAMRDETEGGLVLQIVREYSPFFLAVLLNYCNLSAIGRVEFDVLRATRDFVSLFLPSFFYLTVIVPVSVFILISCANEMLDAGRPTAFSPSLGGLRLLSAWSLPKRDVEMLSGPQGEKFDRGHHGLMPACDLLIAMASVIPLYAQPGRHPGYYTRYCRTTLRQLLGPVFP